MRNRPGKPGLFQHLWVLHPVWAGRFIAPCTSSRHPQVTPALTILTGGACETFCPLLLAVISLLAPAVFSQGWYWQNPLPQGNAIYDLQVIDAATVVAVGDLGVILRTQDGGNTWKLQPSDTSIALYGVHFPNADLGMAVGDSGVILRSEDGGKSCLTQISNTIVALRAVYMFGPSDGVAVGDGGTIIYTIDGGNTWLPAASGTVRDLHALQGNNAGWLMAVGDLGVVLISKNGGETWEAQTPPTSANLYDILYLQTNSWMVVGSEGKILLGQGDEMLSWSTIASPILGISMRLLTRAAIISSSSGTTAVVLKSSDNGSSWAQQTNGVTNDLTALGFLSPKTTDWRWARKGSSLENAGHRHHLGSQESSKIISNISSTALSSPMPNRCRGGQMTARYFLPRMAV